MDSKKTIFLIIGIMIFIIALGIIISLVSCIGCGTADVTPNSNVRMLLRNQIDNPGVVDCTDPVTFKKDSSLAAGGITKDTGLNPSQVYFANIEGSKAFDTSNPQLLKYVNTSNKKVIMCIICSDGKTELQQVLITNGINTTINSTIENETLCVVYPKTI